MLRFDSLGDFTDAFQANTGSSGGRWRLSSGGSTPSSRTGPGVNSAGPYVHTETSATSGTFSTAVRNNSTAMLQALGAGAGRAITLRVAIYGSFAEADQANEGLEVQTRVGDGAWETQRLIRGAPYGSNIEEGDEITDAAGVQYTVVQDGGWRDVEVAIPDDATGLRIRELAVRGTSEQNWRHDMALWQITIAGETA